MYYAVCVTWNNQPVTSMNLMFILYTNSEDPKVEAFNVAMKQLKELGYKFYSIDVSLSKGSTIHDLIKMDFTLKN